MNLQEMIDQIEVWTLGNRHDHCEAKAIIAALRAGQAMRKGVWEARGISWDNCPGLGKACDAWDAATAEGGEG